MLLLMFRHGLRVSEAISLRRADVDLDQARLWISRLKNGLSVEQPIAGDELRAIRRWLAAREDSASVAVPCPNASSPLTRQAVNYIVARAGKRANLGHVNPNLLRHSCGFALANKGHGPAPDPGLSRASGSTAYRTLHTHGRRPVLMGFGRGNERVTIKIPDTVFDGLAKWMAYAGLGLSTSRRR